MSRLKDKIKFGIDVRKKYTGAELYVRIFQITALLHLAIFKEKSVYSVLFDIGIMGLPRAETLALSSVYRITGSEVIVYLTILIIALVLGFSAEKLFKEDRNRGILCRKVFIVLIIIDLLIRLIPMRFNLVMGWPAVIIGFLLRLGCVILLVMDIRAEKH